MSSLGRQIHLALCCLSLLSLPSPLSPPVLSPLPPCFSSSPREQAEPVSSPHCAHSRCSPPLSLPMKEETTGVCMYPPIKTRLVGTLAGWGPAGTGEAAGAPGEAAAGWACRGARPSDSPAIGCSHPRMDGGIWGPPRVGQTKIRPPVPTPSSIALKNQEPLVFWEL